MTDINKLKDLATQIRRDVLRMVHGVKSGHPGGSLGCTDFLTALYFNLMDHNPEFKMDGINEDILIVSNGHISPAYYSTLARAGYFPTEELGTFRKLNSRLQGHPATAEHLPGIRVATGSLGQGMSFACGAALSKKLNKDNKLVFCLIGDGEIEEGQNWEAIMFAAHNKLDNLIVAIDLNGQQIDGKTEDILGINNSVAARLESFGWHVLEMDGNNIEYIINVVNHAKTKCFNGKPIFIVMKTEMGYPVDFMVGSHKWHGISPNDKELESALSQLTSTIGDY